MQHDLAYLYLVINLSRVERLQTVHKNCPALGLRPGAHGALRDLGLSLCKEPYAPGG